MRQVMSSKNFNIRIDEHQQSKMKQISIATGKTEAQLVRKALDLVLGAKKCPKCKGNGKIYTGKGPAK